MEKREILNDIGDLIRDVLTHRGIEAIASQSLSDNAIDQFKERFQGEFIYIPKSSPRTMKKRETLNAIGDLIRDVLTRGGIEACASQSLSDSIAAGFKERFQGEYIYIPKCDREQKQKRNAEIFKQFNGSNHADLCKTHELSLKQIYEILRTKQPQKRLEQALN